MPVGSDPRTLELRGADPATEHLTRDPELAVHFKYLLSKRNVQNTRAHEGLSVLCLYFDSNVWFVLCHPSSSRLLHMGN